MGGSILACEQAGIGVTLPKPMTSGSKSKGRFGKQDFVYLKTDGPFFLRCATITPRFPSPRVFLCLCGQVPAALHKLN